MIEISLNSENYKKYNAIHKAGFYVQCENKTLILIDKKLNQAENYMDNTFRSLDDIVILLSDLLPSVGYRLVK